MQALQIFMLTSMVMIIGIQYATGQDISSVLSPNFRVHVGKQDTSGNAIYHEVPDFDRGKLGQNMQVTKHEEADSALNQLRMDYIDTNRTLTYSKIARAAPGPYMVEIVIVVDKEFGDIFQHDYYRIVDYLTVYFWDVNMRYKTLSEDITWRVNGLLIMESPQAQPFIEQARGSDGRAEFGRILNLYKKWVYEQRSWLVRHDVASLITNTRLEWGGGLAYVRGACSLNNGAREDYGTSVWNDDGKFGSITVAAHELGHNVGAPHDDDPTVNCPDTGFIMGGGNPDRKYFFSKCSDAKITEFVRSDQASCLTRTDGYPTTPIDPNFSTPKALSMQDLCRRKLSDPAAWIEDADTRSCKSLRCVRRDSGGKIRIHTFENNLDNVQCNGASGDRCFRGTCRKVGKQLQNRGNGLCMQAPDKVGFTVIASMRPCLEAKDVTPLSSITEKDEPNGKLLSTPFLYNDNKESGDRCFYTGNADGGLVWTDRCSRDNPWHGWEFRSVSGGFLMVHKVTGRCAKAGAVGAGVPTHSCNAGDNLMIWNLV